ncbi:hypothetical protein BGW38_010437 [Lunasporangiospora selenospora]|uniref:Uncharacterized protein n=1 Tax=Lunasporangiospora selenospora TaxID=979761 RepID=A0A9P6FYI7_9FUNG|nr:hypothetical protein BGW38_010437 [Lunasporangiospora selenospora]
MPSKIQPRPIPLVAVSLASRHHLDSDHPDLPPPYDSHRQHHSSEDSLQLTTASNADQTEAVLHLSRTLVSPIRPLPSPPSSWLYKMIYSITHTRRTATRLYHLLSQPGEILKEIQVYVRLHSLLSQHHVPLQHSKLQHHQGKSIQQLTEEQDCDEDDPDMMNGTATEMVLVSMLNTRSCDRMQERPSPDWTDHAYESCGDNDGIRDPDFSTATADNDPSRRRIDLYPNPFGTNVGYDYAPEDDEDWLGRGEHRSEEGATRSNSVRMTSPRFSTSYYSRIPEFSTAPSSLGPAMDPRQFENDVAVTGAGVSAGGQENHWPSSSIFDIPRGTRLQPTSLFDSSRASSFRSSSPAPSAITISTASFVERPSTQSEQEMFTERREDHYDSLGSHSSHSSDGRNKPTDSGFFPTVSDSHWPRLETGFGAQSSVMDPHRLATAGLSLPPIAVVADQ